MTKTKNKRLFDDLNNKFNKKNNANQITDHNKAKLTKYIVKSYFKELNKKYEKQEKEYKRRKEKWEMENPPDVLYKKMVKELKDKLNDGIKGYTMLFDFRQFRFCREKEEYEIFEFLDGYCVAGLSHKVTHDSFMKLFNWYINHEVPALWNVNNKELRNQYEELIINELNNKIETIKIR